MSSDTVTLTQSTYHQPPQSKPMRFLSEVSSCISSPNPSPKPNLASTAKPATSPPETSTLKLQSNYTLPETPSLSRLLIVAI
ncbi:hypothetical protein VTL71DRAFT_9108 [Oculimacula yallundae]|uniref:Uncharacterized protein n=1 Tax=Oculimacula yallundae TaxID=86028 RepID=A0ABR4BV14_9HELO